MTRSLRMKIAAAATAVAVGGLAAVGVAVRGTDGASVDQAAARPEVVHRKEVRRVPVSEPAAAAVAQPAAQPSVVSEPQPVTSQVSPSGGSGAGYDDEGMEAEDEEDGEGVDE